MTCIEINKAGQNNLKNINVQIPLEALTVICGLSGSGKSSLAFETLYVEGQRRFLQNLSNYLKQYIIQQNPPQVESIHNLPPSIALEQKNNIKSSRSTVASFSGLADHLRLIFEKLAKVYCPQHNIPLESFSPHQITEYLLKHFKGEKAFALVPVLREKITESKTFLKVLKQKGVTRLLFPKKNQINLSQVKNIQDIKRLPGKNFYILLDRFVIEDHIRNRLRDSLRFGFDTLHLLFSDQSPLDKKIVIQTLNGEQRAFSKKRTCPKCSYEFALPLTVNLFNFNSPLGACKTCEGYGCNLDVDEDKVIPNPKISLKEGAIQPFENPSASHWKKRLEAYCKESGIPLEKPWCDLSIQQRQRLWKDKGSFKGIETFFQNLEQKRYKIHIRILLSRYKSFFTCDTCKGSRLRSGLDCVLFHGKSFIQYMNMNLGQMKNFFDKEKIPPSEQEKCFESFSALSHYLKYLNALGLSYLNLNRSVRTLSGGEFQRLNLSSQLGLSLSQVLYVLDEPTVGLHPRDTSRMIELLKTLQQSGNTIVIVEHDQDVMENSDYIIEMGPGSGQKGGEILWSGPSKNFPDNKNSNTVPYLTRKKILLKKPRPVNKTSYKFRLLLKNCSGYNLKNINLFIPLNRFVVITGVSGSGKSSLVTNTLYPALRKEIFGEMTKSLPYKELIGARFLKDVVLMSQLDIVRSSRSSILSYLKAFDFVRHTLAQTGLAKRQRLTASHFSWNVEGGRCPSCKGKGYQEIDMVFMDPLKVQCDDCKGKKFKKEVLAVKFKNKNIDEILNLTVDQGIDFFRGEATILRAFSCLKDVGLSYLKLGQNLASLSGGERQRLKLSRELLQANQEKTLYILDEPTKGLHFKELELLLKVIDRLIETGGSFLVIEHNLELIKEADYVIDMGPEAGAQGGKLLFEGSPGKLLNCKKSHTGRFLKKLIQKSR